MNSSILSIDSVRAMFLDQLLQYYGSSDDVWWLQDVWGGEKTLEEDALAE